MFDVDQLVAILEHGGHFESFETLTYCRSFRGFQFSRISDFGIFHEV